MANRHLSRSIVMQVLYEWDFRGRVMTTLQIEESLSRNVGEFAPGTRDLSFMRRILMGVLEKKEKIDDIIEKAAPEWSIDKISLIDRNILRIGLYELLFESRKEVPAKVAINEAIELAKSFGGETSSKFINGVLGAVYKELGEPGKEETSKKKNNHNPVSLKDLPVERLAGAVVFARHENNVYMALVHDVFGHWTLTKGKLEGNENEEEGLRREAQEELGIPIHILERLGENSYSTYHPEKGKILKHVAYFLAEAPYQELTLEKKEEQGGLDDVRWFKLADILDLNFYDDILPIVTKAITKLAESK